MHKKITAAALILVLCAAALLSACSLEGKIGSEADALDFLISTDTIIPFEDDSLNLTIFDVCEDIEINIDGQPLNFVFMPYWDRTEISFELIDRMFDRLFSLEIILKDKDGIMTRRMVMSDVCIVTDGTVPNGVKTLVLLNYRRDEFPQFESDNLKSLYIIDLPSAYAGRKNKITTKNINDFMYLESLYLNAPKIIEGEMKNIRGLENMRRLVIIDAPSLTGDFSVIDDYAVLDYLELRSTKIEGDISDLVQMVGLRTLKLADNKNIQGEILHLKKISGLRSLELSGGKFSGELLELAGISRLESLSLSNISGITGNISTITELDNLEKLSIVSMPEVYGDLKDIADFAELKSLHLQGAAFEGKLSDIASMSDIRNLKLDNASNITGYMSALFFYVNLESLDIAKGAVTSTTTDLKRFPELMVLHLDSTGITGTSLDIAELNNLRIVNIANEAQLAGSEDDFGALQKLIEITIINCPNIAKTQ
ncbi:MAG: hypothetical protein JXN65_09790 [Clostridia bacterium]|nr:hypothetical protein [Clostridia bacterium]